MRRFIAKLSTLFRRERAEQEIARDVQSQLGLLEEDFQRRGMSADEVRLAARRAYGGVEQAKELARDELTFVWLEQMIQDVRHAGRSLRKSPGFVGVALLSLALGIGANTAIFTLVNGILLKRLPVPDPERIVQLGARIGQFESNAFSFPAFRELQRQTGIFAGAIGFSSRSAVLETAGGSGTIAFELVTGSFFPFFDARPALGRLIEEEDDRVEGAHPVCVLSYQFWQARFGGDPRVLGHTVRVNGVPLQVVGVAQRDFVGPELQRRLDVWAPTAVNGSFGSSRESANVIWLRALARLKPGLSLSEAAARLAGASRGIEDALAKDRANANAIYLIRDGSRGWDSWRSRLRDPLLVLMGAVVLLLLVACANLANMLVARANSRRQEFAVKLSLGISRWRLLRQLLVETFLLVVTGGMLGVCLSGALTDFLLNLFNTGNMFAALDIRIDGAVLAFTFGIALLTALLAGLYPAWQASRTDAGEGLKGASAGARRFGRMRRTLILVQVTAAVVLLFAASLFTRSLSKLKTVDLGYDIDHVLTVNIIPSNLRTFKPAVAPPALAEVLARVRQLPYVESAAFSHPSVLSGAMMSVDVTITDPSGSSRHVHDIYTLHVGLRYFATMRMPLLRGRDFNDSDRAGSQRVVVINQRLASLLWPSEEALGKQISGYEVIGVVGN
ncbi:MAG: ABC transporter permease, partial [Acidobacteria bacterium]|nr:ABC transporter permease [Acidobacteriota bacterium]